MFLRSQNNATRINNKTAQKETILMCHNKRKKPKKPQINTADTTKSQ